MNCCSQKTNVHQTLHKAVWFYSFTSPVRFGNILPLGVYLAVLPMHISPVPVRHFLPPSSPNPLEMTSVQCLLSSNWPRLVSEDASTPSLLYSRVGW